MIAPVLPLEQTVRFVTQHLVPQWMRQGKLRTSENLIITAFLRGQHVTRDTPVAFAYLRMDEADAFGRAYSVVNFREMIAHVRTHGITDVNEPQLEHVPVVVLLDALSPSGEPAPQPGRSYGFVVRCQRRRSSQEQYERLVALTRTSSRR